VSEDILMFPERNKDSSWKEIGFSGFALKINATFKGCNFAEEIISSNEKIFFIQI